LTQQTPPPPKSSNKNGRIVAALLIGLVVGLGIGIVIGDVVLSTHSGAGTNNQVQVSGTISETQSGSVYFYNLAPRNQTISTTSPITNGQYSALLVGGQSYNVNIYDSTGYSKGSFTIYVPLGVSTFTANF
jgi:hypothetical protein